MQTGTLFGEGLTLMVAGMGTVFVFLTALVIAMTLMSRTLARFVPAKIDDGVSDDEVAAISAAIAAHTAKRG